MKAAILGAGGPIGSGLVQEVPGQEHAVMAIVGDLENVQPCLTIAYSLLTQQRNIPVTIHTVKLTTSKQTDIALDEYGSGQPFLFLHGGAGPQSMTSFAQRLAIDNRAHVYVPTHPGFAGTARPDWLTSIGGLADIYIALIEQLDLKNVTVVGSSIGGWIAAEMAVRGSSRIGNFILMDAVGIAVEGQSVVDIFEITLDELSKLSYHNPAAFRIDPTKLTDAQRAGVAANRQALAVYGGRPPTMDPTLLTRLGTIAVPTLVLWGDSDRIATPDYGRAYAAAIPSARFQLLPETGHLPQIETPDQVVTAVWSFVDAATTERQPNN